MIYLFQILSLVDDIEYFRQIFSDLDFELEELGYKDCPNDLVQELLDNHFGLHLDCQKQLNKLTACILNKKLLNSALNLSTLRRQQE